MQADRKTGTIETIFVAQGDFEKNAVELEREYCRIGLGYILNLVRIVKYGRRIKS